MTPDESERRKCQSRTVFDLNIKTKIMTTEETHNFNIDSEDTEIVKDFTYFDSFINLNGN